MGAGEVLLEECGMDICIYIYMRRGGADGEDAVMERRRDGDVRRRGRVLGEGYKYGMPRSEQIAEKSDRCGCVPEATAGMEIAAAKWSLAKRLWSIFKRTGICTSMSSGRRCAMIHRMLMPATWLTLLSMSPATEDRKDVNSVLGLSVSTISSSGALGGIGCNARFKREGSFTTAFSA